MAVDLYKWYLQLAPQQRKTRWLFYDQIGVLNDKYANNPDVNPVDLSFRKKKKKSMASALVKAIQCELSEGQQEIQIASGGM